jgi:hypothetical protein
MSGTWLLSFVEILWFRSGFLFVSLVGSGTRMFTFIATIGEEFAFEQVF